MRMIRKPQHIGVFIKDEMEARNWNMSDLAEMIGKNVSVVSEIINGNRNLTSELAYLFSLVFDISFDFFIKKNAYYEIYDIYKKLEENNDIKIISDAGKLNTIAPVRLMQKKKWIGETKDIKKLKEEVFKFYNIEKMIDDVDELPLKPHFRKSEYGYVNELNITAWSYRIKNLAKDIKCKVFNKNDLKKNIKNIVKLANDVENIKKVKNLLADFGVKLVFEGSLPGTKIDGATFMEEENPVIGLSLRYDRIDYFWFTLMHEIGHVLNMKKDQKNIIDIDINNSDEWQEEKKANEFAVNSLINEKKLIDNFANKKVTRKKIIDFAENNNIHPAIVVGQLQHKGIIAYSYFRNLLEKYKHILKK